MDKEELFMKKFGDETVFCLEYDKETLRDLVISLQNIINKAIEYIENNAHYYNADGEVMFVIEEEKEKIFCKELYEILKGEDIENEFMD